MSKEKKGKAVDAGCRNLTASWVRQRAEASPNDDIELCDYFEVGRARPTPRIPSAHDAVLTAREAWS